ncbi:MAG: hypothetical protein GIX02_01885 [Candidatus Eremiobacteraeota bacterium]|nr:hypothetical protein [Candidatus Eremiobacteraeota bacterium]
MPDKHEDESPKPKPAGGGLKERELAVQLTAAILHAAKLEPQPLDALEKAALDICRRMLHAMGTAGAAH